MREPLPALLQLCGIEDPAPENLVASVTRFVAQATLVAVFLTRLNIERLAEDFAGSGISLVDSREQRAVVGPSILRRQIARAAVGRLERHGWDLASPMAGEARIAIGAVYAAQLGH